MTESEFQDLIQNCQPSEVFNLDWGTYYSLDFAETFLPRTAEYRGQAFHFFDGADLLANIGNVVRHELKLDKTKNLTSAVFYSYPKGVEAEKKKNRIQAEDFAVLAFMEVHQNDKIDVSFKFGNEFTDFLKAYAKENNLSESSVSVQNKIYSSSVTAFKSHFADEISHFNMLRFIGETVGIDLVQVHGKNVLKVLIDDIKVRVSPSEKDFRVDFTTYNQPVAAYVLQVLEGNVLLYEKKDNITPYTFISSVPGKKKTGTEQETGSYTAVWDCSANRIFEEKDPKRKITFKITAITKDGQTASATRKIPLKEYIAKNKKPYNNTDFDENRVVVWLKEDYTPERELLPDIVAPPTEVFAGAKLIRLRPQRDPIYTPCLFWWNNSYHIQEFPEELLTSENNIKNEKSDFVIKNDVIHSLNRILPYADGNEEFNILIKKVDILSKLDPHSIGSIQQNMSWLYVDTNDKVATINRYVDKISKTYNPLDNNGIGWFDTLLVLPLSETWFKSNKQLEERYNTIWLKNGYLANLYGDETNSSGAIEFSDEGIDTLRNELLALKIFLQEINYTSSPESKWVLSITEEYMDNIKRIIYIHDGTWYYPNNQIFAEGVGLVISFGNITFPPLLKVLLHEFGQGNSYFYDNVRTDTHITVDNVKDAWIRMSTIPYNIELLKEEKFTDYLYIGDIGIAIIALTTLIE